jgi:Transposase DDE domain
MQSDLLKLAETLQRLFTEGVEALNRQLGFVQRQRLLAAGFLVRLLVFGWIGRPHRSFVELAEQAQVSAQALQQRLTDQAVALFQALLREALTHVFTARRPLIPLLQRFTAIEVHDATQLALPPSLAATCPACGGLDGQRGQASWKLPVRFDVLRGGLQPFELVAGKTSDRSAVAEPLTYVRAGMLYLADLGYFCLGRLREVVQREAHYVTRLPARVTVTGTDGPGQLVGRWLQQQRGDVVDTPVRIGEHGQLATRLVALRLPEAVAAARRRRRRAKSRKQRRPVSVNQLALCDWWVGITDLPAPALSVEEIRALYGLRWQVELLFKHWKQAGGLGCLHGRTAASVQVEYLAKLLGVVVTHWQALLAGGPLEGKNRLAIHRQVCAACDKLAAVLGAEGERSAVVAILEELAATLKRLRRRPRRKKTPSTRQRLYGKRVRA